ncbi:MAG: AbrB/MazE/SpoVT family DNA-binding domain-containing protein [Caulobacteraceae bacterium]|nr:AbrB/MazE/SpoVT family DNA-binding domain-containing protein [Caulobacteraceae bacterium]
MTTPTVNAKGQVTLRKDLRRRAGVKPGDRIRVDKRPDGRIEPRAARRTGSISDVFDLLKNEDGPALSIEEINEAAARGWGS